MATSRRRGYCLACGRDNCAAFESDAHGGRLCDYCGCSEEEHCLASEKEGDPPVAFISRPPVTADASYSLPTLTHSISSRISRKLRLRGSPAVGGARVMPASALATDKHGATLKSSTTGSSRRRSLSTAALIVSPPSPARTPPRTPSPLTPSREDLVERALSRATSAARPPRRLATKKASAEEREDVRRRQSVSEILTLTGLADGRTVMDYRGMEHERALLLDAERARPAVVASSSLAVISVSGERARPRTSHGRPSSRATKRSASRRSSRRASRSVSRLSRLFGLGDRDGDGDGDDSSDDDDDDDDADAAAIRSSMLRPRTARTPPGSRPSSSLGVREHAVRRSAVLEEARSRVMRKREAELSPSWSTDGGSGSGGRSGGTGMYDTPRRSHTGGIVASKSAAAVAVGSSGIAAAASASASAGDAPADLTRSSTIGALGGFTRNAAARARRQPRRQPRRRPSMFGSAPDREQEAKASASDSSTLPPYLQLRPKLDIDGVTLAPRRLSVSETRRRLSLHEAMGRHTLLRMPSQARDLLDDDDDDDDADGDAHTVEEDAIGTTYLTPRRRRRDKARVLDMYKAIKEEQERSVLLPVFARMRRIAKQLCGGTTSNGGDEGSTRFIIFPDSPFRSTWDICTLLLVLYIGVTTPIRIAYEPEESYADFVLDWMINAYFAIDIVLNFFTAIKTDGEYITNKRAIGIAYVRGWFFIDLVSTVPLEAFWDVTGAALQLNRLVRLVRLFKLLRVLRMVRIFKRLEESVSFSPSMVRVLKFFIIMMFVWHWIACAYWFAAVDSEVIVWLRDVYNFWVPPPELRQSPLSEQYTMSFFWAIMTTQGVGRDIEPNSALEYTFSILIITLGTTMYVFIVSSFTSTLDGMDMTARMHQQRLGRVKDYLSRVRVTSDLENRIMEFYRYMFSNHQGVMAEDGIFFDLHDKLKLELHVVLRMHALQALPLFDCVKNPRCLLDLIECMTPIVFLPNEIVLRQGDSGNCMYIIKRGGVDVIKDGSWVAHVGEGGAFGERALLTNTPRNATILATTYTDTLLLGREDFDAVMLNYPEFMDAMRGVLSLNSSAASHAGLDHVMHAFHTSLKHKRTLQDRSVRGKARFRAAARHVLLSRAAEDELRTLESSGSLADIMEGRETMRRNPSDDRELDSGSTDSGSNSGSTRRLL
eukprot:PLAT15255.1.p1 GENE.PLAT15255.1~~PLAT15255.1.p1  ORF type:complete len:1169 (+),score=526.22 PLAT15255.1:143-3649(+)